MKHIVFIFISFVILFNKQTDSLNSKIYKSHRKSIKNFSGEIKIQHEFREMYINDILELKKQKPNDTIIIAESYAFNCNGCPSNFVQVYSQKSYLDYRLEMEGIKITKYNNTSKTKLVGFSTYDKSINGFYQHSDYMKIIQGLRLGKKLKQIAKDNNTNECYDGSNTIYTVIFTNDEIDCMKIRCWKD